LNNAVAAISDFCFPACNCNQAVCSIGYYIVDDNHYCGS
jgi:hypothetical protein